MSIFALTYCKVFQNVRILMYTLFLARSIKECIFYILDCGADAA